MAHPYLFAHSAYAEDQTNAHAILTVHVLHRGFQAGSLLGLPINAISRTLLHRRNPARLASLPYWPSLIRSTGVAAVFGTAALTVGLVGRMYGRGEIEWQDRAWRLLEHKGQKEVDVFSGTGMVAGLGSYMFQRFRNTGAVSLAGWKMAVGSAGVGNLAGLATYMIWRYGVNGGKWPEEKERETDFGV